MFRQGNKKGNKTELEIRKVIVLALGRIGANEDVVVPLLMATLKDRNHPELASYAATGLSAMGPKAKASVPALIDALDVSEIKDATAARNIQGAALHALGEIGPAARVALPAIRKIAMDSRIDLTVRLDAEQILKKWTMD
jgi:hypothetical protein